MATRRLRWSALITASLILIYGATLAWTYHALLKEGTFRNQISDLRIQSFATLQAQLDEETGLRGFVDTGDPQFLEPLRSAAAHIDTALAGLQTTAEPFQLENPSSGLSAVCKDEKNVQRLWWQTVALPLLEDRKRSDAVVLQLRGKTLIDRFRADSSAIDALLSEQSERSNAALRRDLVTTVGLGVVGSALLLLVGGFAAQASDRAWVEAQRQQQLYENEKQIADKLQQAFLQSRLPDVRGMKLSATYIPAGERSQVGGDWYDAVDTSDGRLLLTVGDVVGHGIEAAVTMVRARQALVATALHESDPAIVLRRVNRTLLAQGATMVSALCGFLDAKTLEFTVACAGHPAPIVADVHCIARALRMQGPPLGVAPDAHYETARISMAAATMLVLYTDGAIEQGRDVIAGERRLLEVVGLTAKAYRTGDVAARICRDILDGAPPRDDVVLLAITFDRAVA